MRYLYAAPSNSKSSDPENTTVPTVLLLHGVLGYSFSWRFTIPALSRQFRVFAPDMLGLGFSDRPPKLDVCMPAVASRVLQFMDLVGIDAAHIVGTSRGGAIAAVLGVKTPQRIIHLVLAAPVNPWSRHGMAQTSLLGSPPGAAVLRLVAPALRPFYGYFLERMYGDPRRIPGGTLAAYTQAIQIPGTLDHLLRVASCWRADLSYLEQIYTELSSIPTLLVWGDRDGAVLPQSARELQNRMANSKLVMLPGVGHLPYEESPQEFNDAVLEFLSAK